MSVLLVTVSDDRSGRKGGKYSETQDFVLELFKNCPEFGISKFAFWKWPDIQTTPFYTVNKTMLDHADPAMNGRCYKPFVISEGMKSLRDGDFLIYNDSSPEMWNGWSINSRAYDLNVIKQLCADNGGVLSATSTYNGNIYDHTHELFTLERCINKMGMAKYRYSLQHASGMLVFQKSKRSTDFVEEWLRWNLIDECASLGPVTDLRPMAYSYWTEEAGFGKVGHRHDQSISGLLLNSLGNKLVKEFSCYNFLNFCVKNKTYEFIDSNPSPTPYRLKLNPLTSILEKTDRIPSSLTWDYRAVNIRGREVLLPILRPKSK